ncbi:MAG: prolyl oligopeptidase family serine peptidase [Bryobacteraceae bacterium]
MRFLLGFLVLASGACAGTWTLERLFTRPYAWGTHPDNLRWSKQGHVLGFLWNAGGRRFLDLYSYRPETRRLARLTDLEGLRDPLNRSAAEKDDRQKQYLMPPEGLREFGLSNDGSRAVFAYRGDIWIVKTDGSEPVFRLTRTKAAESAPQFSPDGNQVAFGRDGQLYVQDLRTAQLWQVTELEEGGGLGAFRWSPDGKRFAYTVRGGGVRRALLPNYSGRLVTAAPFPRSLAGDAPGESRAFVVPAEGGQARALDPGPWGTRVYMTSPPEWSPDSRRVLIGCIHPDMKRAQLLAAGAVSGRTVVVAEDADPAWVEPFWAAWSPDGGSVLFSSDRDGWEHLYVAPAAGGKAAQVTRGPWEVHGERGFSLDPQWVGEYIYYSSTENGTAERQFYRIRPDGSGKERLSRREGLTVGVVSEDARCTATLEADLKNPFDLYVNGDRVTRSPRPEFAAYAWPETHFVNFPSRGDGKPVAAKLLLPPGYRVDDRSRRWPAVFFIHGSGYATSVLKQWGSYQEQRYVFNCHLANRGYVIMDLDYRGSSGYGRDWRTGVYLHMGGRDLDDVLGAVDYLRGLGNIDMQRIGIWGSSYGGFMTAMAMFLSPETFRAGAAFSAVNDWENYNAFYTEQRLTKPQENPEAYRRSSPVTFSAMLRHPLLIVHGMVDNNVMFQDAVQLSEKLIQEGKPFEEAYYPQESHVFVRDETLIDAFRRTTEFFDRHLK